MATQNQIDMRVIESMREEHSKVESSGTSKHLVEVKINLAVALMRWANNRTAGPKEYTVVFPESEELLVTALRLAPGHAGAASNLAMLRNNWRLRIEMDELEVRVKADPGQLAGRPVAKSTTRSDNDRVNTADSSATGAARPDSSRQPGVTNSIDSIGEVYTATREQADTGEARGTGAGGQGLLSYAAALERAVVRGEVDGAVVGAIRAELARVERVGGPVGHLANVRINLGVALMKHGRVHSPAAGAGLYRECEGLLLAALRLDPGHAGAAENLAALRAAWHWRTEGRYGVDGPGSGGGGGEATSSGDYNHVSPASDAESASLRADAGSGARLEAGVFADSVSTVGKVRKMFGVGPGGVGGPPRCVRLPPQRPATCPLATCVPCLPHICA